MAEYWAAYRENVEWNARVALDWERKTFWRPEMAAWVGETDQEYVDRTAALKWRQSGMSFEYIGQLERANG